MTDPHSIKEKIIKLNPTRVWRTYIGGAELDRWHGRDNPVDGNFPEDWIASVVRAQNPGMESVENEGLSQAELEDGSRPLLRDLISRDPGGMLGAAHVLKYGKNMAMLVKIIDSLGRLTIQVHPDKAFAQNVLASDYGKTEAWYILGGRVVDGQNPYVLFGFKPGMTREKWRKLFDRQDIPGMLASLHRIEVKPGEVYLIEGGMPHAIGSGCFLVEIQEPTDYTIRVERTTPEGVKIADRLCHQGAGFDKMFDAFHYDSYPMEGVLDRWRIRSRPFYEDGSVRENILIDERNTKMFEMHSIVVHGSYRRQLGPAFSVMVAVRGEGSVAASKNTVNFQRGTALFLPASLAEVTIRATEEAEIVLCLPPK